MADAAARWGDRPFIINNDTIVPYRVFQLRVEALADVLAQRGIGVGDCAAVLLPNCAEILYLWFALAYLGAVMAAINPALTDAQIAPWLRKLGTRAVVGDGGRVRSLAASAGVVPIAAACSADLAPLLAPRVGRRPAPPAAIDAAAPAAVLLTSGTTGGPKLAVLSHCSYVLPAREFGSWMEVTAEDRFLACLPLFHMAGQAFAISAVAAGASLAVVPQFSAQRFWGQVRGCRATVARHLGEMLAALCREPASGCDREHTLRAVYGGGARSEVAEEFERRFGVPVVEGYGLTETNTVLRNELGCRRRGSIGRQLPYCEVRIAGPCGESLASSGAAAPAVGEIQVRRNPVMMSGYCEAPDIAAGAYHGDWFRTGDLGWCDADGWFYFVSRDKDVIRRRGENLVPAEIEKVLDRHPAVALSAVIGIADELGGEEAKAFVVLRHGCQASADELRAWCRSALADFETPRFFEFCADLPRTETNKIHKSKLRFASTPP
jgi:crotonobetaine/carnitine-CoA ligase